MKELGLDGHPRDEGHSPDGGLSPEPAPPLGPEVGEPDAEIERLRRRLLGGRGPGASERELTVFMHNRPTLGALPTMIERELVQVHTDLARGDAATIAEDLERVRLQLAGTLDQLAARLSPAGLAASVRRHMQVRFAVLLGLPSWQPGEEPEQTGGSASDAGRSMTDSAGVAARASCAAPVGNPWWWQVAIRSFAVGAGGSTLAAMVLAVLVVRRRSRTAPRSMDRRPQQRSRVTRRAVGRRA